MKLSNSTVLNLIDVNKEALTKGFTASTMIGAMYLDYYNHYLTIEHYAYMNNLTKEEAITIIQLGKLMVERLVNVPS